MLHAAPARSAAPCRSGPTWWPSRRGGALLIGSDQRPNDRGSGVLSVVVGVLSWALEGERFEGCEMSAGSEDVVVGDGESREATSVASRSTLNAEDAFTLLARLSHVASEQPPTTDWQHCYPGVRAASGDRSHGMRAG